VLRGERYLPCLWRCSPLDCLVLSKIALMEIPGLGGVRVFEQESLVKLGDSRDGASRLALGREGKEESSNPVDRR